ncbi:Sjogrens syndrome scleroderma autoantigen 1 [Reticulomyxa filosa]|uniref:Sjogrens syndrome scleroderma autoantigen 1 n=1 Tax=Reticulomyxa filosa TaxID=46433 RepID=X6NFX2_RETFI|nr:Sjogrens syndrome scleroderma autoantigen 1 [Reticulomyxa filosa]|eukprot:ETO24659.1 Sjogrens syndrome scleroderma autoantigen 1 [Reticulomyxa filosa]
MNKFQFAKSIANKVQITLPSAASTTPTRISPTHTDIVTPSIATTMTATTRAPISSSSSSSSSSSTATLTSTRGGAVQVVAGGPSTYLNASSHTRSEGRPQSSLCMDEVNADEESNANGSVNGYRTQMIQLLKAPDFWESVFDGINSSSSSSSFRCDFREKLQTKSALQVIAKLRQMPLSTVHSQDKAVAILSGHSFADLQQIIPRPTKNIIADLFHVHLQDVPDLYKGVVIDGLPPSITGDDKILLDIDSNALANVPVDSIEVVGKHTHRLQISFEQLLTSEEINELRQLLKSFLKDELQMDRHTLSRVLISPHTEETWKELLDMEANPQADHDAYPHTDSGSDVDADADADAKIHPNPNISIGDDDNDGDDGHRSVGAKSQSQPQMQAQTQVQTQVQSQTLAQIQDTNTPNEGKKRTNDEGEKKDKRDGGRSVSSRSNT